MKVRDWKKQKDGPIVDNNGAINLKFNVFGNLDLVPVPDMQMANVEWVSNIINQEIGKLKKEKNESEKS